jgi:hypothetical protein
VERSKDSPATIWKDVFEEVAPPHGEIIYTSVIPKEKACNIISTIRRNLNGGDVLRSLEQKESSQLPDGRAFYQASFAFRIPGDKQEGFHRILVWAHPELLSLLKYRALHAYFDCTFAVTPKPFTQTDVLMVYDEGVDHYVPVVYALLDSKHQHTYFHLLHLIIVLSDWRFEPATLTCDFEIGLINAVKGQFVIYII